MGSAPRLRDQPLIASALAHADLAQGRPLAPPKLVAEYQHDSPVMGTWELRQGNQATDGEPRKKRSGSPP